MKIFAWKLALDRLPTQENKHRRHLAPWAICVICGFEAESSYHAVLRCPKARELRKEMKAYWHIPSEKKLEYTGTDWLLVLLDSLSPTHKAQLLLLFWRAWHIRNDAVHAQGREEVAGSCCFLRTYCDILFPIQQNDIVNKGKGIIGVNNLNVLGKDKSVRVAWEKPEPGWAKINVDGAFIAESGQARIGVIIRDSAGLPLLSSWRTVTRVCSAEEVELLACNEGLKLALEWIRMPDILESDCVTAINMLSVKSSDKSRWHALITEVKGMMCLLQDVKLRKVGRGCNMVDHELAQLARRLNSCAVWRFDAALCIRT